jgi:hypothetical protein
MIPPRLPTIRPSVRERLLDWLLAICIGVLLAGATVSWWST